MKKFVYTPNSCDLCGKTALAHEQEILVLVDKNNSIHEALYICPACKCSADNALARKAKRLKKLNANTTNIISIAAIEGDAPRVAMTRELQQLLDADFNALIAVDLHIAPQARTLRDRLQSRIRDLQIIPLGYYSVGGLRGQTSEAVFIARELDTSPNLAVLKKIILNQDFRGCAVDDIVMVSEYSTFCQPGHGYSVVISRQLAKIINSFGAGVIDIVMALQSKGLSPFKAVEQCVHILATLDFSLAEAEAYAESYTAVRKQLRL